MNDIVPVYKPIGITPTEFIATFKQEYPSLIQAKISPAGRLDPMAEGLLLLLVGDANKKRTSFLALDKTYEFTILFGVQTDSYDILGRIEATHFPISSSLLTHKLPLLLDDLLGEREQTYPPFSSKPVLGKPLYYWAREGKLAEIALPHKMVRVDELTSLEQMSKPKTAVSTEILTRIAQVKGDFRQEAIVRDWKEVMDELPNELTLVTCRARVSSGTYIRSLCQEIGEKLGCGAIAYTIKRTAIGPYSLDQALHLTEQ